MTQGARKWGRAPRQALAIHCGLASGESFRGLANLLEDVMTITAPDLVGHGNGPVRTPEQDLHDQCFDTLLPFWPDGQFDLIGHSFGATLAMRIAIEAPERVRSLILYEPVLFAAVRHKPVFGAYLKEARAYGEACEKRDAPRATREFLRLWGDGDRLSKLPPDQRANLIARISLIWDTEPALFDDSADLLPRLDQINAPTILYYGQASLKIAESVVVELADRIPDACFAMIPGAGHMGPITYPDDLAENIRHYLNL